MTTFPELPFIPIMNTAWLNMYEGTRSDQGAVSLRLRNQSDRKPPCVDIGEAVTVTVP